MTRSLAQVAYGPYQTENDIYSLAMSVPWHERFELTRTIRVDVTATKSPLTSLDFVALRLKDAICDRFRDETGKRPDVNTRDPDVRVAGFLTETHVTLYLDLSGEPLFKRGYRNEAGGAPLKENLAAGIIALTGWQHDEPFLDPMCGSGTLVLEAAMMALGVAPGSGRTFGFERLSDFDAKLWQQLRDEARAGEAPHRPLTIFGSDVNPREVERAKAVAVRAGLAEVVTFTRGDMTEIARPAASGVMVANPPYGVRLGEREMLDALYPRLGAALKSRFSGWRCYFFTGDLQLPRLVRLKESKRTPLFNGTIECRLFEFKMVAGSNRKPEANEIPSTP